MVIPDIQTQNLNTATFQPNVSTVDVIKTQDAVAAVNTDSKTGSSTTDAETSRFLAQDQSTKVTLSSDKARTVDEKAEKKQLANSEEEVEKPENEHSMTMTGIPLYGGVLVSVIKYPDGNSDMFDAMTGKPISEEDIALLNSLKGADAEDVLNFESTESYSGLTAAEVYQRIQELLGKSGDNEA